MKLNFEYSLTFTGDVLFFQMEIKNILFMVLDRTRGCHK